VWAFEGEDCASEFSYCLLRLLAGGWVWGSGKNGAKLMVVGGVWSGG
jgi:hypothetical protein